MNIRERLHTIPDLILDKRLVLMDDIELEKYVALLNSFVEIFPAREAKLKAAMETGNIESVIKRLTGIRGMLEDIFADELAEECWKHLNSFDENRPKKMEAYVSYLLSMLAALSIDIQMALFKEEEKDTAPAQAQKAEEENAIKSILAVDDDTYFLDTFKAVMKDVSCKITGATSGLNALYMLRRIKPDLFVLDIDMPGMDGIELAQELRKMGQNAPIIFITGNATKEYVLRCLQAGASDFIIKPINPQNVVSRIGKFL